MRASLASRTRSATPHVSVRVRPLCQHFCFEIVFPVPPFFHPIPMCCVWHYNPPFLPPCYPSIQPFPSSSSPPLPSIPFPSLPCFPSLESILLLSFESCTAAPAAALALFSSQICEEHDVGAPRLKSQKWHSHRVLGNVNSLRIFSLIISPPLSE